MSRSRNMFLTIRNTDILPITSCHIEHLLDSTSLLQPLPTFENTVLAFSCPYRSFLTQGDTSRLFTFGVLIEKERQLLKKILKRYFCIVDELTLRHYINNVRQIVVKLEDKDIFFQDLKVYMSSQLLFVISSSIDVDYVKFDDYKSVCEEYVGIILSLPFINNWSEFATAFMSGNLINTSRFVRGQLERNINKLLQSNLSPWNTYDWNCIRGLMLSKES